MPSRGPCPKAPSSAWTRPNRPGRPRSRRRRSTCSCSGWPATRTARQSGFEEVRDARGSVLSRSDPPRRYQLSYLVTARAPKIAEEHELLDIALRALTDGEALPESCLPPALAEIGMPVRVELDKAGPGHLWTSLGMPARAAFVLSVSAPHRPAPDTDLAPPAEKIALSTDPIKRGPAAGRRRRRHPTNVLPRGTETVATSRYRPAALTRTVDPAWEVNDDDVARRRS